MNLRITMNTENEGKMAPSASMGKRVGKIHQSENYARYKWNYIRGDYILRQSITHSGSSTYAQFFG